MHVCIFGGKKWKHLAARLPWKLYIRYNSWKAANESIVVETESGQAHMANFPGPVMHDKEFRFYNRRGQ